LCFKMSLYLATDMEQSASSDPSHEITAMA